MNHDPHDPLDRYRDGELPEDTLSADDQQMVQMLRASGTAYAGGADAGLQREKLWGRVTERIVAEAADAAPARTARVPRVPVSRGSSWVTRTAGLVAAAGLVVAGVLFIRPPATDAGIDEAKTYTTQRGQRATVELPDGSNVVLAPETKLHYALSSDGERILTLSGQAYFTVTAEHTVPFVVRAAGVATRVLGTAFAVRAYTGDDYTQVAVTEGKVSVGEGVRSAILVAGDVGRAIPQETPTVIRSNAMNVALAWTRGEIVFDGTPFQAVAQELERAYDIHVTLVGHTIADLPVTIAFGDEPLSEVIQMLALTANVRVTRTGDTITFTEQ